MFAENIKGEEINLLVCRSFDGEIIIVDTLEKLDAAVKYLQNQLYLGFDAEARPRFTKGSKRRISLLQFATGAKAFLIRIDIIGFNKQIIDIFENKEILKIGSGIVDDMHALGKMKRFIPAGFVDLQDYTKAFGIKDNSLRKITAIVLGFRISKSQRLSNWSKNEYTNAQKRYAATDAWVCYEIYKRLNKGNTTD
ncbi:MAG: 3'-5' exonuclease domain-containing protein 2 [Prevotellaceae bacterium]|jgi:ribonuclease D|nr:3'-5' exonuclease domain-containing protein 2 [Prevotellaceae bacterium]